MGYTHGIAEEQGARPRKGRTRRLSGKISSNKSDLGRTNKHSNRQTTHEGICPRTLAETDRSEARHDSTLTRLEEIYSKILAKTDRLGANQESTRTGTLHARRTGEED